MQTLKYDWVTHVSATLDAHNLHFNPLAALILSNSINE